VNAYVRYAQGDRTHRPSGRLRPADVFKVFEFLYGEGTAAKLRIDRIDPNKIILKPRLVGIEMKQGPSDSSLPRPGRICYAPSETCDMGNGRLCLEDPDGKHTTGRRRLASASTRNFRDKSNATSSG